MVHFSIIHPLMPRPSKYFFFPYVCVSGRTVLQLYQFARKLCQLRVRRNLRAKDLHIMRSLDLIRSEFVVCVELLRTILTRWTPKSSVLLGVNELASGE
jgi:hypothetical protein